MYAYLAHAIIPCYDGYGKNICYTFDAHGEQHYYDYNLKGFLYRMFLEVHLDPKMLSHWTYCQLHYKQNTPLIIDDTHIFLPIKVRRPISKCDGAMGYVLNQSIDHIQDHTLVLKNRRTIPFLSSKTSLLSKQKDAALLSYAYIDQRKQYEFMRLDSSSF